MQQIQVTAPDLDRIVQNALLFTNEKSVFLDEVLLSVLENRMSVYSSDDYVGITDSCEVTDGAYDCDMYLSIASAKALGEWIKKDKKVVHKYDIKIQRKFTGVRFECPDAPEGDTQEIFLNYAPEIPETFDMLYRLLDRYVDGVSTPDYFALRPERVSRLARIKAEKEAPIDFRGIGIGNKTLLQFKLGDTVTGCLSPVDRNKVDDRFLWS